MFDGDIAKAMIAIKRKIQAVRIVENVFTAHSFDLRFLHHVAINKSVTPLNRKAEPISENPPPRKETKVVVKITLFDGCTLVNWLVINPRIYNPEITVQL